MDPLIPALVAALLAGIGDKPAHALALLADRSRRSAALLAGALAAHALVAAIAAGGAVLVMPMMTPNARALLLALALLFAGIGALLAHKPPTVPAGTGAVAAFLGVFAHALGDRTAFVTFALAVRGPEPALAAVGAVLGAGALAALAIVQGRAGWRALPIRALSAAAGAVLAIAGLVIGAGALRLI